MTVTHFQNERGHSTIVALRLPIFGRNAFTVAPFIFIHKETARKLDPYKYRLMLDHEMVYVSMQRLVGRRTYCRRYLTDKSFRYLVELRAYSVDARHLIFDCGRDPMVVIDNIAGVLSSDMFGGMVSRGDAVKDLCYYVQIEKNKRLSGYR